MNRSVEPHTKKRHYKKTIINAKIDDKVIEDLRRVVYKQSGLKKGDITNAITQALIDYTQKHKRD